MPQSRQANELAGPAKTQTEPEIPTANVCNIVVQNPQTLEPCVSKLQTVQNRHRARPTFFTIPVFNFLPFYYFIDCQMIVLTLVHLCLQVG